MRDSDLARCWAEGDASAGEDLLRNIRQDVYALCYRILKNASDAEDAVQETFANLIRSRAKLREIQNFRKWLATIATNVSINLKKRRRRMTPFEIEDLPEPPKDTSPADTTELDTLRKVLDELPERYRLALFYRFRMELSLKETAELLGVSEGNVRVLLHRAIAHARKRAQEM